MTYKEIDSETKVHIVRLLDWLFKEAERSAGDGDALWYSELYNIKDLLRIVEEYNYERAFPLDIELNEDRGLILCSRGEEAITITNNVKVYESVKLWCKCIVVN
jgi:hypothetical protein